MAKTDEKVMALVEAELKKNPNASVDDLFAKAKKANRGIGRLTRRQFHARYPLQVKRRKGRAAAERKKTGPKKTASTRRKARGRAAPVARRRGRVARESTPSSHGPASGRDAVRTVFLQFAADLAAAEERKDDVKVLSQVDGYVDRALKASS